MKDLKFQVRLALVVDFRVTWVTFHSKLKTSFNIFPSKIILIFWEMEFSYPKTKTLLHFQKNLYILQNGTFQH